jgi:hypothetical protein
MQITSLSWDHANSQVKIEFKSGDGSLNYVILTLLNSIEFEAEMKLRLAGMVANMPNVKPPSTSYVGVFAGASKPKPFQRQRPNLSKLSSGKLPSLAVMRNMAIELHRGSYKPCAQGQSRRIEIAFQHIYEGANAFFLLSIRGVPAVSNQWRSDSTLSFTEEALVFKPKGNLSETKIEFSYNDITSWSVVDNDSRTSGTSGIEIVGTTGDSVFFGVEFVRDVTHTFEFFWNSFKVRSGHAEEIKLGSTHGRPIETVVTLVGEVVPPSDAVVGSSVVVDQDGSVVRAGGKLVPRAVRAEPIAVPPINMDVKPHWNKVVLHQGWLLKKGGIGIGAAKSWIKRYFVLYKTSQGHFLVYYSDITECPLFTSDKNHRNFVDIAKVTFIRPGSNKQDRPDTPAHCFDLVTTEREWTLCAESKDNVQRWLKILTRAVDEDVAILPDEELVFKVKPKVDPLGVLPSTDYTTSLKVSAHGISVTTPRKDVEGTEDEHYFWVYTDFYKWSLLSQNGKLALLVNVFSDASFSRRIEYVFRNKDAQRLATAIEFFIEKFMILMHMRLESMDGAFEDSDSSDVSSGRHGTRLHQLNEEDAAQERNQYGNEIDLLDLLDMDDLNIGNSSTDNAAIAPAIDVFADDAVFSSESTISASAATIVPAPPLTTSQIAQHRAWLLSAIAAKGGPIYDDGTLQVASKIETRGSQCRFTFMFINNGPSTISELDVSVVDSVGLMRFELGALPSTQLESLGRITQMMMLECVKPASRGPQVTFNYVDRTKGESRSSTIDLPLIVTSFNEPLTLTPEDFGVRWQQLVSPGQEAQEVLKPAYPVVPAQVHGVLSSVSN